MPRNRLNKLLLQALAFVAFAGAVTATEADLAALTREAHRLSGSPAAGAAADYIEGQLRDAGLETVLRLDFPLTWPAVEACALEVGGQRLELTPMRPNRLVPPATPASGLSGPLRYLRRGRPDSYSPAHVNGAIAVLDYDCDDNWLDAAARGAKAIIFLGSGEETNGAPKWLDIPANIVRLYAPPSARTELDLRRDQPQATVFSTVRWRAGSGSNVIGFIPGREPVMNPELAKPEVLVLGVHYDTYGETPWQSPGGRGAANCGLLLDLARRFRSEPPQRDLLLLFLDGHGRFHEGARWLYASVEMADKAAAAQAKSHDAEAEALAMRLTAVQALQSDGVRGEETLALRRYLKKLAKRRRDAARDAAAARRQQGLQADNEVMLRKRWDKALRAIAKDRLQQLEPEVLAELLSDALTHTGQRQTELALWQRIDSQRAALRQLLVDRWLNAHVSLDLSDAGEQWAVVIGDHSLNRFKPGNPNVDSPGFYTRVLAACRAAAEAAMPERLHQESLLDPHLGQLLMPTAFTQDGRVAGTHGIYNLALMTVADRRLRQGLPSDTPAAFDYQRWQRLADDVAPFVRQLAKVPQLSLPRVFPAQDKTQLPSWSNGRAWGHLVGLRQTGGLDEDRPGSGATIGLWAEYQLADGSRVEWPPYERNVVRDTEPLIITAADANGRFPLVGVRRDYFARPRALALRQDAAGEIAWIVNRETLRQPDPKAFRIDMFPAGGGVTLSGIGSHPQAAVKGLRVLNAASDADFHSGRVLYGAIPGARFFYLRSTDALPLVKLFQVNGVVALGTEPGGRTVGVPVPAFETPAYLDERTARDLWQLNEYRLNILRSRGVSRVDLERLHSAAEYALADADSEQPAPPDLARSVALSRLVYQPLRQVMDDLVHAIIVLLLLSIPFAFAMERLLLCSTTVYGRLGGFSAFFVATLLSLYFMHPGFAIAATPVIVFLAFVIILLSGLVIYIVVRKFESELESMRGQAAAAHSAEVSRTGTLIAAVGMGMSTMRRRPIRTLLTAVTVTMLSFTILCFASVSSRMGVRSLYEGTIPRTTAPDLLVRDLAFEPLDPTRLQLLAAADASVRTAAHWWRVGSSREQFRLCVTASAGRESWLDGMLGLTSVELENWPAVAEALGLPVDESVAALANGDAFLSAAVAGGLHLRRGDGFLAGGRSFRLAGTFDSSAMQRLKHLDGGSILPINFQQAGAGSSEASEPDASQIPRLGPDQVLITSAAVVRQCGGKLYAASLYVDDGTPLQVGRRLSPLLERPLWVRTQEGARRLLFTLLTEVRGAYDLIVPLLLGALIIFGTMLGSIADREREIYTFSALGLAPAHVGFLFFAEAAVYAVVGGMWGQLLAQVVGHVAASLAEHGVIKAVAINFSSTNSLFAIAAVMVTVILSAVYPAIKAGRSANPGLQRRWQLPPPEGDRLQLTFPFTVSAYDATGVMSFLAEHFEEHQDAGLGVFAAQGVCIARRPDNSLQLTANVALAPFDLGVTQDFELVAVPSQIAGVEEIEITMLRRSGTIGDWRRAAAVFIRDLRRQFLLWRTLSRAAMDDYRRRTLTSLREPGPQAQPAAAGTTSEGGAHG